MRKVIKAMKYELLQILRQKIYYLIIPISMYFLFFATQRGLNEITLSAYVVQTLIFAFLFIGYQVGNRDTVQGYEQLVKTMTSYFKKVIGKIASLWICAILVNLILIIEIIILSRIYNTIPWLVVDSIKYILLYFLLSSIISATLGLLVSSLINNKSGYFILFILGGLIGPLGIGLAEQVFAIFNINAVRTKEVFVWLNLAQYDPNIGMNLLYGPEIESKKFIHHLLLLSLVLSLYFLTLYFRKQEKEKFKKSSIRALFITLIFVAAFTFIYQKPVFLYKAGSVDDYGRDTADLKYYSENNDKYKTEDSYKVLDIKGEIDIRSYFTFSGDIYIKLNEPIDEIDMTLYHGFIIEELLIDEESCTWEQKRDVVNVKLDKEYKKDSIIKIHMNYGGMSSQYFFAGERGALLTNYFPFLPYPGENSAMTTNPFLSTIPLIYDTKVNYELMILSKKETYSNLDNKNETTFSGTSNHGLMLIGGNINKHVDKDIKFIYTDDVSIDTASELIDHFNTQILLLVDLLELKPEPVDMAVFAPIKNESLGHLETSTIKVGNILYTSMTTSEYSSLEEIILIESLASLLLSSPKFVILDSNEQEKYADTFISWYKEEYDIEGDMPIDKQITQLSKDQKLSVIEDLKLLLRNNL